MIKGVVPATPSRAFALWLALLVLYFMLLPSAAQTPLRAVEISAKDAHTVSIAPGHRAETPARHR